MAATTRRGPRTELARSTRSSNPSETAPSKLRLAPGVDGDSEFWLSGPRAAVETAKGAAGSGGGGKGGGGGGGSSSGAALSLAGLLSDDDADNCLRNTDSDDDSAATGNDGSGGSGKQGGDKGGGGSGGGSSGATLPKAALQSDDDADGCLRNTDSEEASAASGDDGDDDGPVLCRCGARDWQDGARWIQCDARGCRTWEHLRCAYPRRGTRQEEKDDPEAERIAPPDFYLCAGCSAKGSSAAAGRARRGGRRCLTRCGEGAQPSPTRTTASGDGMQDGAGAASRVRRSERVSGKEMRRVPLTKNVVGEELSSSSSSDGEMGGVGPSGSLDNDRGGLGGAGSSDDDDFWAPEGHVETSQEYRCRCGVTLQKGDDAVGGGDGNGEGDGGNASSGRWVQCRSDACGVWEHATCCDHGCSLAPSAPTPAASATDDGARRHWCRACDPKGKKHARWDEKMRKKMKKRARIAKGAGERGGARATGAGNALAGDARGGRGSNKKQTEEREGKLLGDIWRAVISGDPSALEELFREADGDNERSDISVERLLTSGQPHTRCLDLRPCSSRGCDDGGRKEVDAGDNCSPVLGDHPVPAGLSVLMLAAGFWSNFVDASAARAAPAEASTVLVDTESSSESAPVVTGDRSAPLVPGATRLSAADGNPETGVAAAGAPAPPPSTAADAADETARSEVAEKTSQPITDGGGGSAGPAGAAVTPLAATEPLATAATASKQRIPPLGSEARLAVLRLVLERGGRRAVLAADGEGRTAAHHAAAVNGAAEAVLLLGGELGEEAALAKVKPYSGTAAGGKESIYVVPIVQSTHTSACHCFVLAGRRSAPKFVAV